MLITTNQISYIALICSGLALRSIISLHGYSGAATPPMYGDYEAQRHWQEICVNLPASAWYENSTNNDLLYWGLDYPPHTAYHSLLLGKIAGKIDKSYVELHNSRGFESDNHKIFMRLTVLAADVLILIPALVLAVTEMKTFNLARKKSNLDLQHLAICLLYPGQILIDNGHFQYNNISLGLAALAIVAILRDRLVVGSILFSLALNYKQMELYHAVPFFVYLLSCCVDEKTYAGKVIKLVKIGSSVILTFAILWLPWINSLDSLLQVIRRIFPIYRGVFEDKVSNVWCVLNVIIKFKTLFSNERMALICLFTTGIALIPSAYHLFRQPSKRGFLYSLFNSSLTFFLFSFQVHEKSILLAALPAVLLFPIDPFMVTWFLEISIISMFPLLQKDKLVLPFICLYVIFHIMLRLIRGNSPCTVSPKMERVHNLSSIASVGLVFCQLYAPVPKRLPHLFVLAISVFSCIHFVAFLVYSNYRQLSLKTIKPKTS